eukprot:Pgem_evm1s13330
MNSDHRQQQQQQQQQQQLQQQQQQVHVAKSILGEVFVDVQSLGCVIRHKDGEETQHKPKRKAVLDLNDLYINEICLPIESLQLSGITVLNLDNNNLTQVPDELFQLSSLIGLSLTGNRLTTVPETISRL